MSAMSTISTANVRANKATGARAKKESGKATDSSDGVVREPNEETLAAIAELEAGNGMKFDTVDDMMAYFDKAQD